jgi:hypothetical protein
MTHFFELDLILIKFDPYKEKESDQIEEGPSKSWISQRTG